MKIFILVEKHSYQYLGLAATSKKAEKAKLILLKELSMAEPDNIIILEREVT